MDCYSGRTADERPVRFRLEDCQYMVEEVLDQWYGPQDAFYKAREMTAISISCAGKHRRLTGLGIWYCSGQRRPELIGELIVVSVWEAWRRIQVHGWSDPAHICTTSAPSSMRHLTLLRIADCNSKLPIRSVRRPPKVPGNRPTLPTLRPKARKRGLHRPQRISAPFRRTFSRSPRLQHERTRPRTK